MREASLIATLTTCPSTNGAELTALPKSVGWLEVRADLVGDLDPEWLRDRFRGRLLYALRCRDEGGNFSDSSQLRHDRLAAAARGYDRVELEVSRDLSPTLLAEVPVEKRLLSWHGRAANSTELEARFRQLLTVPATLYKLVNWATKMSEEFTCLALLKSLGRSDTIAYSTGLSGFWSRLVALHLGAAAIFGVVPSGTTPSSDPTITKLIDDYGLPSLPPIKEVFAIVASPVFHSLSPRLHNAGYHGMNYPAMFLPLQVESFEEFWLDVVQSRAFDCLGLLFNGMTVASPHKEAALQIAKIVSPMASRAESANILVRNNGLWNADTTDPEVVYMAGRERCIDLSHKRAAVIGCGGAGRAIAAALIQSGAGVTLINRSATRGHHAAKLLGLPYNAESYDIIVNATPVGRDSDEVPFNLEDLHDEAVVIDLVYGARPTPLIANSLAREQIAIDGREVLLTQVLRQFRMMTGQEMPVKIALDALGRGSGSPEAVNLIDRQAESAIQSDPN